MGDVPCLYCSGNSYEPLFENVQDRLGHASGRWGFRRCLSCGSATLFPHPKRSELASFYPPVYDFTPDLLEDPNLLKRLIARLEYRLFLQPQYEAQARRILRSAESPERPNVSLLDVGCGGGLRLLAFRRRGIQVQGVDFRPETVEQLRRTLGVPAVCADASRITDRFPSASFDIITCFHLLEHLPDAQQFLRSCFQLLKPGRWLVCAVPLVDSLQARLFKSRWTGASEAPRHLSLPSQEGMRTICRQAGFDKAMIRPDSLLSCLGIFVLSFFPNVGRRHLDRRGWLRAATAPVFAVAAGVLATPWCLLENHVWRRPASGLVFARKPG